MTEFMSRERGKKREEEGSAGERGKRGEREE